MSSPIVSIVIFIQGTLYCTECLAMKIARQVPAGGSSSIGTTVDWYLSSKQAPLSHDMWYVIQCNYNYSGR